MYILHKRNYRNYWNCFKLLLQKLMWPTFGSFPDFFIIFCTYTNLLMYALRDRFTELHQRKSINDWSHAEVLSLWWHPYAKTRKRSRLYWNGISQAAHRETEPRTAIGRFSSVYHLGTTPETKSHPATDKADSHACLQFTRYILCLCSKWRWSWNRNRRPQFPTPLFGTFECQWISELNLNSRTYIPTNSVVNTIFPWNWNASKSNPILCSKHTGTKGTRKENRSANETVKVTLTLPFIFLLFF